MMLRSLFFYSTILLFIACKNDTKQIVAVDKPLKSELQNQEESKNKFIPAKTEEDKTKSTAAGLPSACGLFSREEIADIMKLDLEQLTEADGYRSAGGDKNSVSCFWRVGSEGIMVQLTKNPFPDDMQNYAISNINNLLELGEQNHIDKVKISYKKFDGPGIINAMSLSDSRFYSAVNNEVVASVFFNGISDKEMLRIAPIILKKVHAAVK